MIVVVRGEGVCGENRVPGDEVSVGSFIEQVAGGGEGAALGVSGDEGVGEERISG